EGSGPHSAPRALGSRPRRRLSVLLPRKPRRAAGGGSRSGAVEPPCRHASPRSRRALPRRRLPRDPRVPPGGQHRDAAGRPGIRPRRPTGLRRTRWPHVPRREPRRSRRPRAPDGGSPARARPDAAPAAHPRLPRGAPGCPRAPRAPGDASTRSRVPCLALAGAPGDGGRLPGQRSVRGRVLAGGLPGRQRPRQLRPPPLRLVPGGRDRLRRGLRAVGSAASSMIRRAVAAILFSLLLSEGTGAWPGETRDMIGRRGDAPETRRRRGSLAPSPTETAFALGAAEQLVGVTDFCDFPPEARLKPRIGGIYTPSFETILSLRPDLVLATTVGNREEHLRELERLGVVVYV